jgi:hypothetical protein
MKIVFATTRSLILVKSTGLIMVNVRELFHAYYVSPKNAAALRAQLFMLVAVFFYKLASFTSGNQEVVK